MRVDERHATRRARGSRRPAAARARARGARPGSRHAAAGPAARRWRPAPRARRPARAPPPHPTTPERRRGRARPPAALAGRAGRSPSRSRRRRSRASPAPPAAPTGTRAAGGPAARRSACRTRPPSTNGSAASENCRPAVSVASPTASISGPVRLSGRRSHAKRAGRDEPPRPSDPDIGDRDPALGQVVGAGRERQHRRAEGDGEHAEGGRGAAPGPQAELSHASTSSRN